MTTLHYGCWGGNIELCKLLLSEGLDVKAVNNVRHLVIIYMYIVM